MARDPECVFCKIVSREIPAPLLYENELVVAFNDLDPQAPTHILIIPREHHANAAETSEANPLVAAALFSAAAELARGAGLDGYRTAFNTGASAGQSVFHTHLHLLGGRAFAWPPG
jgi:histidine triad (HIT) family protein